MILTVEEMQLTGKFAEVNEQEIELKLKAIEKLIREYTNNNFQNRFMRISASAVSGNIIGYSPYFRKGDTLQISDSLVNDGLYTIASIEDGVIGVKESLYDNTSNLVTKVVYPDDIKKGVIDMMTWEQEMRAKVGVKSEALSRHSVTYYDQDSNNQVMGYPISILGFLEPYMRARF